MTNKTNGKRGGFRSWVNGDSTPYEENRNRCLELEQLPATPEPEAPARRRPLRLRRDRAAFRVLSVVATVALCLALVFTVYYLPRYGDANMPANNEVSQRYVQEAIEETGAVNAVAGMILDYRAFDTFGESTVLFTATMAVTFLMRIAANRKKKAAGLATPSTDTLLRLAVCVVFPFVMMFGIYVVLNGHLSPGGGFSGGSILGAGLILTSAALGEEKVTSVITPKVTTRITVVCLLCYAGMKSFSFFTGANHMAVEVSKGIPGAILSSGFILPLNVCVGIIVGCTMFSFYSMFSKEGD